MDMTITIYVRFSGISRGYQTTTISKVKDLVHFASETFGITEEQIMLVFKDARRGTLTLEDAERTVRDCGFTDGCQVHVMDKWMDKSTIVVQSIDR